jgi:hypothetical protein
MLFAVAAMLCVVQLGNLSICITVGFTTLAAQFGRGSMLVPSVPVAVIVQRAIAQSPSGQLLRDMQLFELAIVGLVMAFMALAYARIELGRSQFRILSVDPKKDEISYPDRYRLRPTAGLMAKVLLAVLGSYSILLAFPFRYISKNVTGLEPVHARMMLLVWILAAGFLAIYCLLRWLRWRQQSRLEARMHVLQVLGDQLLTGQAAIVRRASAIRRNNA